jgi:hypothetical protein
MMRCNAPNDMTIYDLQQKKSFPFFDYHLLGEVKLSLTLFLIQLQHPWCDMIAVERPGRQSAATICPSAST